MELLPRRQPRLSKNRLLKKLDYATIVYHDVFGYPLTILELKKWQSSKSFKFIKVKHKDGYYFLEGREDLVSQRKLREKISVKKMKIVKRAGKVLGKIPMVVMVGVTGSLAMMNANINSDIDLMIVTSKNSLWVTRVCCHMVLWFHGYKTRRANDKNEKDKLCLNIWMDEADLKIRQKNIYTAHEIAQIVPLVNKNKTYEKLLWENGWILEYWPRSVAISRYYDTKILRDVHVISRYRNILISCVEMLAFQVQYQFMKKKITREVVTPTRAFFHPFDWGRFVKARGF